MLAAHLIGAALIALTPSPQEQGQKPVQAQAPASATQQTQTAAERRAQRDREVVCENRARTGSTLQTRHCSTRRAANETEENARRFLDHNKDHKPNLDPLAGPN